MVIPIAEKRVRFTHFNGKWYASAIEKQGSSHDTKSRIDLFAFGSKLYLEITAHDVAEISAPQIPLSENHHSFLLFYSNKRLAIVIADGSCTKNVIIEEFYANPHLWKLLLISVCAMIRRHDSEAADEIEKFWNESDEDSAVDPKNKSKPSIFQREE